MQQFMFEKTEQNITWQTRISKSGLSNAPVGLESCLRAGPVLSFKIGQLFEWTQFWAGPGPDLYELKYQKLMSYRLIEFVHARVVTCGSLV